MVLETDFTPIHRRLILLQKFKIARLFLHEDVPPDHKFRLKYAKKDSPSTSEVSPTAPNMSIAALPDDSNGMESQSTNSNVSNKLPTNKIPPTPSSSKDHPFKDSLLRQLHWLLRKSSLILSEYETWTLYSY